MNGWFWFWAYFGGVGILTAALAYAALRPDKRCSECQVISLTCAKELKSNLCNYCMRIKEDRLIKKASNIIQEYKLINKID